MIDINWGDDHMNSKKIAVPKYLHELFGQETTLLEVLVIFIPATVAAITLILFDLSYFIEMGLVKAAIFTILMFDIMAGVIANLTAGTNDYYARQAAKRLFFIAIHIQPLIFSWLLGNYFTQCLFAWVYTITASLLVNKLSDHPLQRQLSGALFLFGLVILVIIGKGLPAFLLITLIMFMIKVIYSFSVNHTRIGKRS